MISSSKWEAVSADFQAYDGASGTYASSTRVTARLESQRRSAMDEILIAVRSVADLEAKLEVIIPWTEDSAEYISTLDYIQQRNYHRALDTIQRLVIQRLFEASKANMSEMGQYVFIIGRLWLIILVCRLQTSNYHMERVKDPQ